MDANVARHVITAGADLDDVKFRAEALMVKLKESEDRIEQLCIYHIKQTDMIRDLQNKLNHLTNMVQIRDIGIPPYFVGKEVHEYWRFQS